VREEDEDVGAFATGKCVDRRAASVAGGGADNGRALATLLQGIVHQPGEQLHRDILERQRRAVEQLHDEAVRAGLDERGDRRVTEGTISLVDHGAERLVGNLAVGERRKDRKGSVVDIPLTHGSVLLMGETMQEYYEHHIPKTARQIGPRINLTFRISDFAKKVYHV